MNRLVFFSVPISLAIFFGVMYAAFGIEGIQDSYQRLMENLPIYFLFIVGILVIVYFIARDTGIEVNTRRLVDKRRRRR